MSIKLLLYIVVVPLSMLVVSNMKLEHLFKKNQTLAITLFYLFLSLGISYLVVSFIYDVYEVTSLTY